MALRPLHADLVLVHRRLPRWFAPLPNHYNRSVSSLVAGVYGSSQRGRLVLNLMQSMPTALTAAEVLMDDYGGALYGSKT